MKAVRGHDAGLDRHRKRDMKAAGPLPRHPGSGAAGCQNPLMRSGLCDLGAADIDLADNARTFL